MAGLVLLHAIIVDSGRGVVSAQPSTALSVNAVWVSPLVVANVEAASCAGRGDCGARLARMRILGVSGVRRAWLE